MQEKTLFCVNMVMCKTKKQFQNPACFYDLILESQERVIEPWQFFNFKIKGLLNRTTFYLSVWILACCVIQANPWFYLQTTQKMGVDNLILMLIIP